jgi:cytochrome c oxidase subunit 4
MSGHIASVRSYILVFAALLVFTGITVAVAFVDLGVMNTVIALGIAAFKASLVVLFFMHLRWSPALNKLLWLTGLLFLVILLVMTMNDYLTRGWQFRPGPWSG